MVISLGNSAGDWADAISAWSKIIPILDSYSYWLETVVIDIFLALHGMNEWKLVICSGIRMATEYNKVVPEVQ